MIVANYSAAMTVETVYMVVTLPTFRCLEQLLAALDSLIKQKTSLRFAVIVMENKRR